MELIVEEQMNRVQDMYLRDKDQYLGMFFQVKGKAWANQSDPSGKYRVAIRHNGQNVALIRVNEIRRG